MCFKLKYKIFLYILLLASILGLVGFSTYVFTSKVPDKIVLKEDDESVVDLSLPFIGTVDANDNLKSVSGDYITSINFNNPVAISTGDAGTYEIQLKLFGLIDYKNITIDVVEDEYLYACGMPVGVYLKSDGILVIDNAEFTTNSGQSVCPSNNIINAGDYIISLNGQPITGKNQLIECVKESNGEAMVIGINRGGNELEVKVTPQIDSAGEYKLGLWVRDDTQGIGTLTYIDEAGNFGALGHGISDTDTGDIFGIDEGILYKANILTIIKGQAGDPGEYVGTIDYSSKNQIGLINGNNSRGIFGVINEGTGIEANFEKYEIGYKYDAKPGEAYIVSGLDEHVKKYRIQIDWMDQTGSNVNKGIEFTVTDPELLKLTNGIVQGMSGSPIIQDGKIIGAVTHVFVNDSTKGYGIFIENMLEH